MKKIASFTVNHIDLLRGIYVSRKDYCGDDCIGPMGCRTGYYLLMKGELTSKDVAPLVTDLFKFMADFEGEVPGAAPRDCGNYLDMNLGMAKYESKKFLDEILMNLTDANLIYPE